MSKVVRHWSGFGLFVAIESFANMEKCISTPTTDSGLLTLKIAIAPKELSSKDLTLYRLIVVETRARKQQSERELVPQHSAVRSQVVIQLYMAMYFLGIKYRQNFVPKNKSSYLSVLLLLLK
jgi:hypothetical protein